MLRRASSPAVQIPLGVVQVGTARAQFGKSPDSFRSHSILDHSARRAVSLVSKRTSSSPG